IIAVLISGCPILGWPGGCRSSNAGGKDEGDDKRLNGTVHDRLPCGLDYTRHQGGNSSRRSVKMSVVSGECLPRLCKMPVVTSDTCQRGDVLAMLLSARGDRAAAEVVTQPGRGAGRQTPPCALVELGHQEQRCRITGSSSVETKHAINGADFGRLDQTRMCNRHRVQRTVKLL